MKTMKILFVLCIILGFAAYALNAQSTQNGKYIESVCWPLDCVIEHACGDITHTVVINKNKGMDVLDGTLFGLDTHTVYTIHHIYSMHWDKGEVFTQRITCPLHADGKLIAQVRFTIHWTLNANGEQTAFRIDPMTVECK